MYVGCCRRWEDVLKDSIFLMYVYNWPKNLFLRVKMSCILNGVTVLFIVNRRYLTLKRRRTTFKCI